jgi:hypothetical protein
METYDFAYDSLYKYVFDAKSVLQVIVLPKCESDEEFDLYLVCMHTAPYLNLYTDLYMCRLPPADCAGRQDTLIKIVNNHD